LERRAGTWTQREWGFKIGAAMEYCSQVLAIVRISLIEDPEDGFNGRKYWAEKALIFDSWTDWAAEKILGFSGQDLLDVLSTKLNVDANSEEYTKAYQVV
jgi:hypothetical protein